MQDFRITRAINGSFKKLDEDEAQLKEQNDSVDLLIEQLEEKLTSMKSQTLSTSDINREITNLERTLGFHKAEWNKYTQTKKRSDRALENIKTLEANIKKVELTLHASENVITKEPTASANPDIASGPSREEIDGLVSHLTRNGTQENETTYLLSENAAPKEKNNYSFWTCFGLCKCDEKPDIHHPSVP